MSADNTKKWDSIYDTIDGMYEYKGLLCLPCMTHEIMDDLTNKFEFEADDVVIVSYPQSGFFWLQETLYHLHNQDQLKTKTKDKEPLAFRVPFMEHEFRNKDPMELLKDYKRPRIMKTHLPFRYMERQMEKTRDKTKVILWTMDPKSTIGNYHNFWNTKCGYFDFPKIEWEKFFELSQTHQLFEGDWYETNLSWVNEFEGKDNFLLLTYEESKKDPLGTARKIADFCGVNINAFKLEKVAYMVDYDKVPDHKERFSEEQVEIVNKKSAEKLAGTILEEKYVKSC